MDSSVKTMLEEVLENMYDDSNRLSEIFEKMNDVKHQELIMKANGWIVSACDIIHNFLVSQKEDSK